jgi:3-methyladenine DNA glycosylase Tag
MRTNAAAMMDQAQVLPVIRMRRKAASAAMNCRKIDKMSSSVGSMGLFRETFQKF